MSESPACQDSPPAADGHTGTPTAIAAVEARGLLLCRLASMPVHSDVLLWLCLLVCAGPADEQEAPEATANPALHRLHWELARRCAAAFLRCRPACIPAAPNLSCMHVPLRMHAASSTYTHCIPGHRLFSDCWLASQPSPGAAGWWSQQCPCWRKICWWAPPALSACLPLAPVKLPWLYALRHP